MNAIQKASDALLDRLLIWHKLHAYHHEVGDESVILPLADLWNPADQAAVDAYTRAKAESQGQRPLFEMEMPA